MYVCVCNAVTESHIGEAVADGCRSMRELRERLGVGACCGRCSACAREVLHAAIEPVSAAQEIQFATAAT
ncbi:MAG: (2Fe-2S)-binding protein [Rhodocyclaceae bacterium]|nr:(2Fe-2S)-binding protein [Rhodocyclaceae bacterium]